MNKLKIKCVGFIMDGNRRWARENKLPTMEGHKKGTEVLIESINWIKSAKIPNAVYYAFSTENWHRSKKEVSYLMDLFSKGIKEIDARLGEEKEIRVRFVGLRRNLPKKLQMEMQNLETKSTKSKNITTTIWIAISYGGRAEIVEAVNKAISENKKNLTEKTFEKLLWTGDLPDPDLIVRTGGDNRLSNFMTWKSVYSELLFLDKYWPTLTKRDFDCILKEYESRERRKGR